MGDSEWKMSRRRVAGRGINRSSILRKSKVEWKEWDRVE